MNYIIINKSTFLCLFKAPFCLFACDICCREVLP